MGYTGNTFLNSISGPDNSHQSFVRFISGRSETIVTNLTGEQPTIQQKLRFLCPKKSNIQKNSQKQEVN